MVFKLKNIVVNDIIQIDELSIPHDQVTCIVGQSGSGKSTFLRLLNDLRSPDQGDIYYLGESLKKMEPVELRKQVLMVPQTPVIFEGSIEDNLQIGLTIAGSESATNEQMAAVLKKMKLHKSLTGNADDLSGGEKQRLAMARVMLMNAKVYLLDEPTSSLDDQTTDDIIKAFLDHTRKHQQTVIMVTHNKKLADEIGEFMIQMDKYRVENVGDSDE